MCVGFLTVNGMHSVAQFSSSEGHCREFQRLVRRRRTKGVAVLVQPNTCYSRGPAMNSSAVSMKGDRWRWRHCLQPVLHEHGHSFRGRNLNRLGSKPANGRGGRVISRTTLALGTGCVRAADATGNRGAAAGGVHHAARLWRAYCDWVISRSRRLKPRACRSCGAHKALRSSPHTRKCGRSASYTSSSSR